MTSELLGPDGSGCGEGLSGAGDCQEAIHTLYHYLDGELTIERRVQIRQHLDDCSPCLGAFDFEAELKTLISRRCREEVPDELRSRVAEALRSLSEPDFFGPASGGMFGSEPVSGTSEL